MLFKIIADLRKRKKEEENSASHNIQEIGVQCIIRDAKAAPVVIAIGTNDEPICHHNWVQVRDGKVLDSHLPITEVDILCIVSCSTWLHA